MYLMYVVKDKHEIVRGIYTSVDLAKTAIANYLDASHYRSDVNIRWTINEDHTKHMADVEYKYAHTGQDMLDLFYILVMQVNAEM